MESALICCFLMNALVLCGIFSMIFVSFLVAQRTRQCNIANEVPVWHVLFDERLWWWNSNWNGRNSPAQPLANCWQTKMKMKNDFTVFRSVMCIARIWFRPDAVLPVWAKSFANFDIHRCQSTPFIHVIQTTGLVASFSANFSVESWCRLLKCSMNTTVHGALSCGAGGTWLNAKNGKYCTWLLFRHSSNRFDSNEPRVD